MDSADLYSSLLSSLSTVRNTMMSQKWTAAVAQSSPAAQNEAFKASFAVQHAINVLSNQVLNDIADEMAAEAVAINDATSELTQSLQHIQRVSAVLDSISKILGVIGKIVSLV
jgi:hypothetical protein